MKLFGASNYVVFLCVILHLNGLKTGNYFILPHIVTVFTNVSPTRRIHFLNLASLSSDVTIDTKSRSILLKSVPA